MPSRYLFSALMLAFALGSGGAAPQIRSASAASGADCRQIPGVIEVPQGSVARGFEVESIVPGRACSGKGASLLGGLSVRRGGEAIFFCKVGDDGAMSCDPGPLSSLTLEPGSYQLFSAPSAGSSVRLTYRLAEEKPS